MCRIDLLCKLVAPLGIGLLHGCSATIAIWTTFTINIISVGIEYGTIVSVFHHVPTLVERRPSETLYQEGIALDNSQLQQTPEATLLSRYVAPILSSLDAYVRQSAFLPSLALSVLYLNVFTFSGQMTTFMLALKETRITSTTVGVLRAVSNAVRNFFYVSWHQG